MAFRKPSLPGAPAPMKVPAVGATPSAGPKPPALSKPVAMKPIKNTRDYGKPAAPPPSPFGPTDGGF